MGGSSVSSPPTIRSSPTTERSMSSRKRTPSSNSANNAAPAANTTGRTVSSSRTVPASSTRTQNPNPQHQELDLNRPTPYFGRGQRRVSQAVEQPASSPSAGNRAAPPSSLSEPANPRQPFDFRLAQAPSSTNVLATDTQSQPAAGMAKPKVDVQAANPAASKPANTPAAPNPSTTGTTPPAAKAVPVQASSSRTDPPPDNPTQQAASSSEQKDKGKGKASTPPSNAERHSTTAPSVHTMLAEEEDESWATDTASDIYFRNTQPLVRIFTSVGRKFELFDEDIGGTLARYYNFRLLADRDPLERYGVQGGNLPGFSSKSTMRIREALIRWEYPLTDFWEDVPSAIEDRLAYSKERKHITQHRIKLKGETTHRRVYSIGSGSNDLGYWGHLILALTQILEVFQEELSARPRSEPPFQVDAEFALLRALEESDRGTDILVALSNIQLRLKLARERIRQYLNALRYLHDPASNLSDISSFQSTLPEIRTGMQSLDLTGLYAAYAMRPGYRQYAQAIDPDLRTRIPTS
ncbi:hypothetical protein BDZ89DRAFT_1148103 [Hymenopellis radicata]|nr:hypothetical protein BDZ89DRAFT_1148103 [Hymenopellis radicata]